MVVNLEVMSLVVWLVDVMVATMAVEWVASMDPSWVDCECIHVHECECAR